jgi:predicted house-cleaning NTP pyrophosphatase (Maf/HAM1 superfamily)
VAGYKAQARQLSGATVLFFTGTCIYLDDEELEATATVSRVTYSSFDETTLELAMRAADGDAPKLRSAPLGIFYDSPGLPLVRKLEGSPAATIGLDTDVVVRTLQRLLR